MTDDRWWAIEPSLPGKAGDPGRTAADNRLFVNAVLFVAKAGIPWRDPPERFGRWNSVWRRFDRWCAAGVWERIAKAPGDPGPAAVQLDSTSVKAHPVASAGRRLRGEKKGRPTSGGARAAAAAGWRPRRPRPWTAAGGSCGRG